MAGTEHFTMTDGEKEKSVEVDIIALPKKAKKRLLNLAGNIGGSETKMVTDMFVGDIVDYFITSVVEEARVDGEKVRPSGGPNERKSLYDALPDLYDEESEEEIDDRIIRLCVKHNPRVASNPTLSQVFARYRVDDVNTNPTTKESSEPTPITSASTGSDTTETLRREEAPIGVS